MALPSPWLDAVTRVRRGDRWVLLYPWHRWPDPRPDMERIEEGYAADSVESWFPIDDHHWYFTRDDLGRLFQETTGIRGDLYLRKTHELRQWLARSLYDGEVRAYRWDESPPDLSGFGASPVAVAYVPQPLPPVEESPEKCEYCGKTKHELGKKPGNNVGTGGQLEASIFAGTPGKPKHRWHSGSYSLAAHHLICSESLNSFDWEMYCDDFGYDINSKDNGVMLPSRMDLACQLHAPLHRGGHSAGESGDPDLSYPGAVKKLIKEVSDKAKRGNFCDNPAAFIAEMNSKSRMIIAKVDAFAWTLTSDGHDYAAGKNGCAGVDSVTDKPLQPCPLNRAHNIPQASTGVVISKKTTLEIGT